MRSPRPPDMSQPMTRSNKPRKPSWSASWSAMSWRRPGRVLTLART